MMNDAEENIRKFLDIHKNSKGRNKELNKQFKKHWEEYISSNSFSHQAKLFLVQGKNFGSSDLLREYICSYFSSTKSIEDNIKEEFTGSEIPPRLLEQLVFMQELNNQEMEISKQNARINSLENKKLGLESDVRVLNDKIEALRAEIEHLNNEIVEQKRLREVVSKDEKQKTVEAFQKIANALRYGHETFKEAKDMNMSLELGEVLRDQLGDIYSVLSKYGVRLEA